MKQEGILVFLLYLVFEEVRVLKKYPFVKQDGEKECGVACLLMIIKYHRGYVPNLVLNQMTKTGKDGTNAYRLLQAAKELGMETRGIKISFSEWTRDLLILPCIVPVLIDKIYEHYVVLYEIDFKKKKLIIADPARNIQAYSFADFEKIYRNTLLFLYPIATLPVYSEQTFFKSFLQLLKPHWKLLFKIIIVSLFIIVLSLISSYHLKSIIEMINLNQKSLFSIVFLAFSLLFFIKISLEFFRNILVSKFYNVLDKILTPDILKTILSLPYPYYRLRPTGDFLSRIQDLAVIRSSVLQMIVTFLIDGMLSLCACFIIYQIHHLLFFLVLLLLLLLFIVHSIFQPIFEKLIRRSQEEKSRNITIMIESISGFETIKGLNLMKQFSDTFRYKYLTHVDHNLDMDKIYYRYIFFKDVLCQLGYFILLMIASYFTLKGVISFGSFLVFQAVLTYVLEPLQEIFNSNISFKEMKQAYLRVVELDTETKSNNLLFCSKINQMTFNHLTYPKEEPILKDINCNFYIGEKIMLIGPSGSGKSTLLKILKGYEKVERGMYQIDGLDFCDFDPVTVQEKVDYLSQNEILFTDTIYHNLLLNRNLSLEELKQVNWICELDTILKKRPMGYHTLLEENGFNVSGGEKDRIVLARTLLNNNKILLIDEGLSQVDHNMERRILKRIFETNRNHLIIMISHRLDNLDLFDRVIEMKQGKIVADSRKKNE